MFGADNHGSQYTVADVIVGKSGKPCRVFSATWLSDGTARDLVLRNGSTDAGTIYVQEPGVISKTKTLNFEGGLLFPGGCFIDIGSAASVVIEFRNEL
jgi:hypothetical protein